MLMLAAMLRGVAEAERATQMMVCPSCPDVSWDGASLKCWSCGATGQPGILPVPTNWGVADMTPPAA